jgi:hypothetical protein
MKKLLLLPVLMLICYDIYSQTCTNPSITNQTQSICSGTAFTISPTDGSGNIVPVGTTYTWSNPVVTGGLTGGSAQTTSQSNISQTLTNITNTAQTATYIIIAASGTCTDTFTAIITVNPKPNITNQTQSICSGTAFTISPANGGGNIVPVGTTYTWTNPNVTGGITGGSAQATGLINISQTLTNPTNVSQTATYNITATSGSCTGTFSATITVNPKPNITSSQNQTICSGASFTVSPANGGGNIVPASTTYTWSNPTVTGGITGGSAQSTGQSNISQTLTNPTNVSQTATYTITPTSGFCVGNTFTAQISVLSTPSLTTISPQICSGDFFQFTPQNDNNNIVPVNTTLSWTTQGNNYVNGITLNAVNQNSINDTLVNLNYQNNLIKYLITPSTSSCTGDTFSILLTVLKKPNLISSNDQIICEGQSIQIFTADQFGNQNLFFDWSDSPNTETINFPFINNPIVSPNENSIYIVKVVDPVTNCIERDTIAVNVNSLATLTVTSTSTIICEGDSITLSSGTTPADWYEGTLLIAENQNQIIVNPDQSLTYVTTLANSACPVSVVTPVIVNPSPSPTINGPLTTCKNSFWQSYTVNSSSNHSFNWNVENGEITSGQGTSSVFIHWYNNTEGNITLNEYVWETGCNTTTNQYIILDGIAPDMIAVMHLEQGSNVLICQGPEFSVYKWGYESKIIPGAIYVNSNLQYCQFPVFDPVNYYYFVEHGNDSMCLTRSYLIPPAVVTGINRSNNPFDFKITPNPVTDILHFTFPESFYETFTMNLFTVNGKLVTTLNNLNSNSVINISELINGIYFVELKCSSGIYKKMLSKL